MASYSNQKHITLAPRVARDIDNVYAMINRAAMEQAGRTLKPRAFQVWLYINSNQDGYDFWLSSVALQNAYGMSDKTYREAVNELIALGYLKQDGSNQYTFYERGYDADKGLIQAEIKKQCEAQPQNRKKIQERVSEQTAEDKAEWQAIFDKNDKEREQKAEPYKQIRIDADFNFVEYTQEEQDADAKLEEYLNGDWGEEKPSCLETLDFNYE